MTQALLAAESDIIAPRIFKDKNYREVLLPAQWEKQLPTLFNLEKRFETVVMQKIDDSSSLGSREFFLALKKDSAADSPTRSALHAQPSYLSLTPFLPSIKQLESYASKSAIDILHQLFEQNKTQSNYARQNRIQIAQLVE